ncbi:B3 domain-containing protein At4g34400-like [Alnus glutinosa]|uniref:B3 domain-containing protein At4g34400-like n=1 Tax=Alnus glutinosa TaxID=3517 RepID=UPI002D7773D4|nr:B3 domain-containing protein At4g34400-like [Alnus glutinosa]
MACKVEACPECTQKCLLVHGKKKNLSPLVTSFFKVMIGDRFSQVLFLPPKFAATVSSLVNQKTFLEDSSGQQWGVTISNLNGSLAFEQGWSSFSSDHGLQVGDFVIFNYIMGSHFDVKIFDTTGCEKIDFPENSNAKKRARLNWTCTAKHGKRHTIGEGSMSKYSSSISIGSVSDVEISQSQCEGNDVELILKAPENILNSEKSKERAKPVSKAEYIEEPYYIIDRDFRDKQGNDRSSVLDLFSFETINDVTNKAAVEDARFPSHTEAPMRSQIETCLVVKDPVKRGGVSRVAPADAPDFETIEKKASLLDKISCDDKTSWHLLTKLAVRLEENEENMSNISNRGITRCPIAEGSGAAVSSKIIKEEQVGITPDLCSHKKIIQEICGNESNVIKEEHNQSSYMIVRDKDIVPGGVKVEPIVLVSSPIRVVATESQSFLELPACLPSSYQGRAKLQRRVVLLRDPAMRLWPVLYHERSCFRVLTNGWEAFSKANGIQPGDECVFGVESDSEGIYGVHIARR